MGTSLDSAFQDESEESILHGTTVIIRIIGCDDDIF